MNAFIANNGSLVAVLCMAVVTIVLRLFGFWFVGRFTLTPALRRGLDALPVSIFVASVVPLAIMAGPAGWIATSVAAAIMYVTGQEFLALGAAVAIAAGMRALGF